MAGGHSGGYKGKGKYVKITSWDRKTFRGYLATPPGRKGPGILLCQEIFGINGHIREIADQYAEEGYFVLAPDLFHRLEPNVELGYGEEDFKKAFGFYQRFDRGQGRQGHQIGGRRAAQGQGLQREGRSARLLPWRQARLSGSVAGRRRCRHRLLRRRHREQSEGSQEDQGPAAAAFCGQRPHGSALGGGQDPQRPGQAVRVRELRLSRRRSRLQLQGAAVLRQAGRRHGLFAQHRLPAPASGAPLRSLDALGPAYDV